MRKARFLGGAHGRKLAHRSASAWQKFNAGLVRTYGRSNVRVADVAGAFDVSNFHDHAVVQGIGRLPVNVANECR